jgi:transcriptional regulator with XRE-family HTH domain|tara:strand:- start:88 stop:621 length:534 start_codon:yes stop_codon:yes gene_type:complete
MVLVWMCKHQWTNQYLYEVTMTNTDPVFTEDEEHAIRSNMRRIRETISVGGRKPLSLRQMADKLGTTPMQLSRFETGKKSPFYNGMVVRYANALDVPIDLFYQSEPKLTASRQEVDLLDIGRRRYEALATKLAGTEAALKKTQNIVSVQTLLLKEQDRFLKRMQGGLKRMIEREDHD